MKRIVVVLLLFASVTLNAQKGDRPRANYSPEQMATLKTKKLTLALDLTKNQQDQVYSVLVSQITAGKAHREEMRQLKDEGKEEFSTEERFDLENKRLDHQIALSEKMESILDAEQYQEWKKLSARHHEKYKKKMKRRDDRK